MAGGQLGPKSNSDHTSVTCECASEQIWALQAAAPRLPVRAGSSRAPRCRPLWRRCCGVIRPCETLLPPSISPARLRPQTWLSARKVAGTRSRRTGERSGDAQPAVEEKKLRHKPRRTVINKRRVAWKTNAFAALARGALIQPPKRTPPTKKKKTQASLAGAWCRSFGFPAETEVRTRSILQRWFN